MKPIKSTLTNESASVKIQLMKKKGKRHEPIAELKKALSMSDYARVAHAPKGVKWSTSSHKSSMFKYTREDIRELRKKFREMKKCSSSPQGENG